MVSMSSDFSILSDNDDLPMGWVETTLGAITKPSDKKVEPTDLIEIPYIGLEHIEKDTGKLLRCGESEEVKSTKSRFQKGDLLYGKLRPYLNKVYHAEFDGICSTDIIVFPKNQYISNKFLNFRFLSRDFVGYANQNVNGTQHPRVSFQSLSEFPLQIPPLNEQRRIVEKVEALMARSRKAKEALDAIPKLIEQFRQSVLAAAFRGDLTTDWREQNPNIEPASILLERIRKERRKKWEQTELEKMKAKGKEPLTDDWNQKYKEPELVDESKLPELPDGWCWVRWNQLGYCQNGRAFPSNEYQDQGVKLLRPGNLHMSGYIEWNEKNTRFMPENWLENHPDFLISENQLVINLTAQSLADEFLGRVCLTGEGENCLLNQRIARLTPSIISPRFCLWLFKSPIFRRYVDELNTGSLIQHIFTSHVDNFVFPLPPLEEQQEIIRKIEHKLKIIEAITQTTNSSLRNIPDLNQSILSKAFKGELVEQDPNDEPASVLLERIQKEREKEKAKVKQTGAKKLKK